MPHTLWQKGVELDQYPTLANQLEADVVVVGGGITGVMSAYVLAKRGKKVVLLEKDRLGSRETANTTAFLNYPIDADLHELAEMFDEKTAVRVWQSATWVIDQIEDIVTREEIDCDFIRCPLYMFATDEEQYLDLEKEYTIAQRHRFPVSFSKLSTPLEFEDFLECDLNAKFHPLKFLAHLARRARGHGALLFEHSEVLEFSGRGPVKVRTKDGQVIAQDVIFATHVPPKRALEIDTRIIPFQTYIIVVKVPKGTLAEAMYIDMEDPYHYFRIDRNDAYDLLTLGGEDHETGKADDTTQRHHRLEVYLRQLMPQLQYQVMYRWSGEIFDTIDGLPFIGPSLTHQHHLIATGYAGDGMIFGPLSAFINADHILGNKNPWADLYRLNRFKQPKELLKRGYEFGKELIKGRIGIRHENTFEDIPLGSGRVVKCGGKKMAVYRDEQGNVTRLSPVCRHMGCIVGWNEEGKSWDCPCHGSRYDRYGKIMNGPTRSPLRVIQEEEGFDSEF